MLGKIFTIMTTIKLEINEKTKKGKALLAYLKAFHNVKVSIESVAEPESEYSKEFVSKIEKATEQIKQGKVHTIETDSIWDSI